MAFSRYNQSPDVSGATRFNKSAMSDVEFSRMKEVVRHLTSFNGGDIVPIWVEEVLPHSTFSIDLDAITRLTTALRPTMGDLVVDYHAFWVPNRIVNDGWKNVQGENTSGIWSAPEVSLAPLYPEGFSSDVQIPVGSVADYYGLPTQAPIKAENLHQMNDLIFRGYVEIFNNNFRDQNYQPPLSYSKLNVYNGFLQPKGSRINLSGTSGSDWISTDSSADGSFFEGAVVKSLYGDGSKIEDIAADDDGYFGIYGNRLTNFSALDKPLKANKLHDMITSVLPSPQKGQEVVFNVSGTLPVEFDFGDNFIPVDDLKLKFRGNLLQGSDYALFGKSASSAQVSIVADNSPTAGKTTQDLTGINIEGSVDLADAVGISVNDLRTAAATQQCLEILARGGSRYVSVLSSFFDVETATPFVDIPLELGHVRRTLDMYQVAQTSASETGNTAQGNLTAFGYTNKGGKLFTRTFIEHGFVHILMTVRQKNVYSTFTHPHWFRKTTLDYYLPPLANISEQPVLLRTLNPFLSQGGEKVLGYQEAWWEYRSSVDRISGEMRTGVEGSLDVWHYGDAYDASFQVVNGDWLKSNAQEVIDRTIAVTSALANQFITYITFTIDKQIPMPTYSIPGLDVI